MRQATSPPRAVPGGRVVDLLGPLAVQPALTALAVGGGLLLLLLGLVRTETFRQPLWRQESLAWFIGFAAAEAVLAGAAMLLARRHRHAVAVALPTCVAIFTCGIGPVAAASYLFLGAYAVGSLAFGRRIEAQFDGAVAALLSTLVGLALVGWVLGFAAHVPVNSSGSYGLALGLPVILARHHVLAVAGRAFAWLSRPSDWSAGTSLAGSVLAGLIGVQVVYVALPEEYHDALGMHLRVATDLLYHGVWRFDPQEMIGAVMPIGSDLLFAAGYLLGGESAARLVNYGFLLLTVGLLLAVVAETRAGRTAGLWTAAVLVSTPVAFVEAASLFTENPLAAFQFGGLTWLVLRRGQLRPGDLAGAGVLLGAAMMTKLQAAFFVLPTAVLALVLAGRELGRGRRLLAGLLAGAAGLCVVGLPPYLTALIQTGNPVFPVLNAVFKSPYFYTDVNFDNPLYAGHLSWRLLYDLTFSSRHFLEAADGAFGFQWLVLLGAGLLAAALRRDRLVLSVAGVGLACAVGTLLAQQYIRYVYPVFPEIMVACSAVAATWRGRAPEPFRRLAFGATCAVLCVLNVAVYPSAGWILRVFDLRPAVSPSARAALLDADVPQRHLIEALNAVGGPSANVLLVGAPVAAGLQGRPTFLSWYNPRFYNAFTAATDEAELGRVLRRTGVTHAMLPDGVDGQNMGRLRTLVQRGGKVIQRIGSVALVELGSEALFPDQLVADPRFERGAAAWQATAPTPPARDGAGLMLPAQGQVSQPLAATLQSGEPLRVEVTVSCPAEGSWVRLQLGWLDEQGRTEDVWLAVHECGQAPVESFADTVRVPPRVEHAVAFGVAGERPIQVRELAVRR